MGPCTHIQFPSTSSLGPLLCRPGRVPSAGGCVTAVCVGRRRAAVRRATWWDWPVSTATTMSTSTWRGMMFILKLYQTLLTERTEVFYWWVATIVDWSGLCLFVCLFVCPDLQHSEGAAVTCRETQRGWGLEQALLLHSTVVLILKYIFRCRSIWNLTRETKAGFFFIPRLKIRHIRTLFMFYISRFTTAWDAGLFFFYYSFSTQLWRFFTRASVRSGLFLCYRCKRSLLYQLLL